MIEVKLNGQLHSFAEGTTILSASRQLGIEIPTLCHDERLKPSGACRLCAVEIQGWSRHTTACNTVVQEGMEIETHSPSVEEVRRTLLHLLALEYPAEVMDQQPEKQFHHWLKHYRVTPNTKVKAASASFGSSPKTQQFSLREEQFQDGTHPYLRADFTSL